jgi:peptide deformylase
VRAYNADGNEFVMSGRGLLAQIFQHENDHLNGVLFIDKATGVQDLPPEK